MELKSVLLWYQMKTKMLMECVKEAQSGGVAQI